MKIETKTKYPWPTDSSVFKRFGLSHSAHPADRAAQDEHFQRLLIAEFAGRSPRVIAEEKISVTINRSPKNGGPCAYNQWLVLVMMDAHPAIPPAPETWCQQFVRWLLRTSPPSPVRAPRTDCYYSLSASQHRVFTEMSRLEWI